MRFYVVEVMVQGEVRKREFFQHKYAANAARSQLYKQGFAAHVFVGGIGIPEMVDALNNGEISPERYEIVRG